MQRNRESAMQSRQRRKMQLEELERRNAELEQQLRDGAQPQSPRSTVATGDTAATPPATPAKDGVPVTDAEQQVPGGCQGTSLLSWRSPVLAPVNSVVAM